jgi:hypothetical protein
MSPHNIGRIRNPVTRLGGALGCAEIVTCPVAICTITLPVVFAATVSLVGLKEHAEFAGSDPH